MYKVEEKVYLSLQNVHTDKLNKKLDDQAVKFTVTEVISSSSYRLNTPLGIHNVFNVNLLQPAANDLLLS